MIELLDTKTQEIRLVDVFLIAPAMITAGFELNKQKPLLGNFLIVTGMLTGWYNGRNYLRRERGELPNC